MGLFDSFVLDRPLVCPHCGNGKLSRFQTKALDCLMHEWNQGDPVKFVEVDLIDADVKCCDICEHCQTMVNAKAVIRGRIFERIELDAGI